MTLFGLRKIQTVDEIGNCRSLRQWDWDYQSCRYVDKIGNCRSCRYIG
ncbi:hypothetical protein NIES2104_30240 [Leptolyngbya sp. NIES-2104]|nr:hypothetical protein NIES2104_30240 [Leptolyngbya sp. NIES-2104]